MQIVRKPSYFTHCPDCTGLHVPVMRATSVPIEMECRNDDNLESRDRFSVRVQLCPVQGADPVRKSVRNEPHHSEYPESRCPTMTRCFPLRWIASIALAFTLQCTLVATASAQFGSSSSSAGGRTGSTSSSSPFGSTSGGFGSNSSGMGGMSGMGSAMGGGTGGSGTFANAQGLGAGGAGFRGAGSGNLLQGMGANGNQRGGTGMGMGMGGMGVGMGMGMGMGMGGMGMGRNNAMMFGGMNQNMNSRGRSTMRIPVRLGFQPAAVAPVTRAQNFEARLTNLPNLPSAKNITVSVSGRTAILTGSVGSEHEKELLARLAKLEPGISDVQNDLEVVAVPTEDANP